MGIWQKNPKPLPKIDKEKGQALHQGQNNPGQQCGLRPDWVRSGPEPKGLGMTMDAMQASGLPVLEERAEAGEDPDKGNNDGVRGLINMSCVETVRELSLFSLLKGMLRKTQEHPTPTWRDDGKTHLFCREKCYGTGKSPKLPLGSFTLGNRKSKNN